MLWSPGDGGEGVAPIGKGSKGDEAVVPNGQGSKVPNENEGKFPLLYVRH